jgi:hypothetical protein
LATSVRVFAINVTLAKNLANARPGHSCADIRLRKEVRDVPRFRRARKPQRAGLLSGALLGESSCLIRLSMPSFLEGAPTVNVPIFVFTSVPTGRPLPGGLWLTLATVYSPSADGQVMHPVLLQISIEPSSDTAHPQRAPLAVLSIHMRTAVICGRGRGRERDADYSHDCCEGHYGGAGHRLTPAATPPRMPAPTAQPTQSAFAGAGATMTAPMPAAPTSAINDLCMCSPS